MNTVFLAIHSCIQARTFKAEKNHMARREANDSGKAARSLRRSIQRLFAPRMPIHRFCLLIL